MAGPQGPATATHSDCHAREGRSRAAEARAKEENQMSRNVMAAIVAAGALAVSACGSTSFNTTWVEPNAQMIQIEPGEKVLAMVISQNESTRRGAEAALASELGRNGAEGVPAYTVIPDDAVQDQNKAKPYIEKSGAQYAVIMRATGKDKEVSSTPTMGGYGMYGPGWGGHGGFYGGFYGYGWGGAYGGSTIRTDTIVYVETLVYDLKSDKLIWAGQSSTMNPSNADKMVKELVDEAAKEMQKQGLLPKK